MKKVLILTTGGSDKPLVESINKTKPDYVIFICSKDTDIPNKKIGSFRMVDGEGYPCEDKYTGEKRESIIKQTGLGTQGETYEKIYSDDMDDLGLCYEASIKAINRARQLNASRIRVDYTGGTKTMSAALAMAAVDEGDVEIYLVGGERNDLIKVATGTEMLRRVEWSSILWARSRPTIEELFKAGDYLACIKMIDDISEQLSSNHQILGSIKSLCQGFYAWEEFRHKDARNFLQPFGQILSEELAFLNRIIKSYESYENQIKAAKGDFGETGCSEGVKPNMAMVHDILRNAERRLEKKEYDDAVGRIYRALELIAQICLLYNYPPIFTSDVKVDKLPIEIQEKYVAMKNGKEKLQIGLTQAYDLLYELKHPAGVIAYKSRNDRLNLLEIRNNSIFAHGLKPVKKEGAEKFYNYTCDLLNEIEETMKLPNRYKEQVRFPLELPVLKL